MWFFPPALPNSSCEKPPEKDGNNLGIIILNEYLMRSERLMCEILMWNQSPRRASRVFVCTFLCPTFTDGWKRCSCVSRLHGSRYAAPRNLMAEGSAGWNRRPNAFTGSLSPRFLLNEAARKNNTDLSDQNRDGCLISVGSPEVRTLIAV